jgi:hypothetical protein
MIGLCDIPFSMLAAGWGELLWVVFIFGIYAVGAISKLFTNRKGAGDQESTPQTAYVVELAKKRARQRQEQARLQQVKQASQTSLRKPKPLSEWDRVQEAKRLKREQLRQKPQQPFKSAQSFVPANQQAGMEPRSTRRSQPAQTLTGIMQEAWTAITSQQMPSKPIQQTRPARQPIPQSVRRSKKISKPAKLSTPAEPEMFPQRPLESFLKSPQDLRAAIVLKEILDKPVALRENW